MPILDATACPFWETNGYVVLPNAVPQKNLDALVRAIWEFLEMRPNSRDDWYSLPPFTVPGLHSASSPIWEAGMVSMYQHQTLWDNRQHPRIYEAFKELLGTSRLWVSLDRVNMKPPADPNRPEWGHKGMVHWDVDTSKPELPLGVQGVLYLTDTAQDQGGFQCVAGFHNRLKDWIETQPTDRNVRFPDLNGLDVEVIPGKAGDLLIWNQLLPHGNGHNTSDRPRLAQYITMTPAEETDEELRQMRIQSWRERQPVSRSGGRGIDWPADPRDREHNTQMPAQLTGLGKKLLGATLWDD